MGEKYKALGKNSLWSWPLILFHEPLFAHLDQGCLCEERAKVLGEVNELQFQKTGR